jgi:hypothetical protein
MERRRYRRIEGNLESRFISGSITYPVIIENFSEEGVFIKTEPLKTPIDFDPKTRHELRFKLPSGEVVNLDCEIRWFHTKSVPDGLIFSIGIKVMNPSSKYKEFVKTMQ